jgi:hypothetical protein
MKYQFNHGKYNLEISPKDKNDFKNNWVKEINGLVDWTNSQGEVKKVFDGPFCKKNYLANSWLYICKEGIYQVWPNGEKKFIQFGNNQGYELAYTEVKDILSSALSQL